MTRPFPRPLSMGEVLDTAFHVYRMHFLTLFLTTAISVLPFTLLWGVVGTSAGDPTALGGMFALLMMISVPLTLIVWSALAIVVERALAGQGVAIGTALVGGLMRLLPLIGTGLIVALLFGIAWVIVVAGVSLLAAGAGLIAGPIGAAVAAIVLGVVGGLAFFLWWGALAYIALPTQVIEVLGPIATLKRTSALLRGARMRTGAIALVAWLIVLVPNVAIMIAGAGFAGFSTNPETAFTSTSPMLNALMFLVSALTTPYFVACAVVAYFDRRARSDGYDLELASQALASAG